MPPVDRLPRAISAVVVALAAACTPSSPAPVPTPVSAPASSTATGAASSASTAAPGCCLEIGLQVADRHRNTAIATRRFTHAQLWAALDPTMRTRAVRVAEIGRSIQGRPIRALTYGSGPTTVLLWSQMHGDESTATMSLVDLLGWFTSDDVVADSVRARIAARLTVVMVPMLNPDGAELFQRQNALGVDVNRDARRLSTPEARALKTLRDSIRPAFGFNLHDQNARTLTAPGGRQVGIALLAPAVDEQGSYPPGRAEARLVAAGMAGLLEREIPGRVARYDDGFNPRAFGDLMQAWGTRTVLIESGALPGDPEKQRLRELNVMAILSALDAIATGRYSSADPRLYDSLPENGRAAADVLVRGGRLVMPGSEPALVDLALDYEEPVARLRPRVREVGDLVAVVALDTVDADGLFLHPSPGMLTGRGEARWLRINAPGNFTIRRGSAPTSELVRTVGDEPPAAARTPADALSADTLRIDGSAGVRPLVEELARAYRAVQPSVTIQLGDGLGSKARIDALDEGRIQIAMASHGVDLAELERKGLAAHEIARVAVVFGVHESVSVAALSERQICALYAGDVTDWRMLGGQPLAVAVLGRPVGEVDADVVAAGIGCFPKGEPGKAMRMLAQPDEMAAALASTRGAIGMTSLPFVQRSEGRIRAVSLNGVQPTAANVRDGTHPLTRQSFLLVRAAPTTAVERFLAFVRSADGARVIEAGGAVPLP